MLKLKYIINTSHKYHKYPSIQFTISSFNIQCKESLFIDSTNITQIKKLPGIIHNLKNNIPTTFYIDDDFNYLKITKKLFSLNNIKIPLNSVRYYLILFFKDLYNKTIL